MTGDGKPEFTGYPPDFFDFIIIDECHRGGANDESGWRGILEHFSPAVQLGLTATPKRRHNADTYGYFGEPVYSYALREGIEDGFLTPFKVRQMASTIDAYVYHPEDQVLAGEVAVGDALDEDDFNSQIIIPERELKAPLLPADSAVCAALAEQVRAPGALPLNLERAVDRFVIHVSV